MVLQVIDEYNKTHGVLTEPSLQEREQGIGKRNDETGMEEEMKEESAPVGRPIHRHRTRKGCAISEVLQEIAASASVQQGGEKQKPVYIVSGVHRTLTKEAFAEEITFATDYLLNAIKSEPRYRQLRSSELRLCISEGLKGRLCDDLGYPTTKTILRWIEAYSVHETRILAMNEFWRIGKRR